MNIRARLLLIVFFAVLVPALFVGLRVVQDRDRAVEEATNYIGLVARNIADDLDEKILGTAQLHYGLISAAALQARATIACSEYLGTVRNAYPQYVSILTAEPNGRISCNSRDPTGTNSLSLVDRPYFNKALHGLDAPILEPLFGRVSGQALLQIAFPVRHSDHSLRFLLVAGLDLARFAVLDSSERSLVPEMEILFVDRQGTVLVWNAPDRTSQYLGSNIRSTPLYDFAMSNPGGAITEIASTTNGSHVWAVAPRSQPRDPGFQIMVGLAKSALIAPADQRLIRDLSILAGVALAMFAMAIVFAEFGVRRPMGRILRMASHLASGDLNARIVPPYPRGEIGDLMKTLNDTAESVQAHRAEISELDGRLRQSQKMEAIGQLTGGIAHDFNNLLTVILGNSEQLKEHLQEDPEGFDLAQITETAAARGSDLTKSLLAFARRQSLAPKLTDINELLSGMANLLRRSLGEHIECRFALGSYIWPVRIDQSQLTTAILNLAVNARDAMPNGGQLIVETLNVMFDEAYAQHQEEVKPGDYVMIAVTDTGTGMSPLVLTQAIEPFFTTKEVGKGSGLGLSMVYGFVKQSGGHINIYSELDHGTTIKLYLPRSNESGQKLADIEAEHSPRGGSERILVVEDDEMVRGYVQNQLARFGYRVHAVTNALEAIAVLESDELIDLLFTDIVMPGGMSGLDLAERARVLRPELKILFTSGYTENVLADKERLGPEMHLLNKPYRRNELAAKLRLVLQDGEASKV